MQKMLAVTMAVMLAAFMGPAEALGVTAAEKKAEIESVEAQLSSINDELESAVDKYNAAQMAYEKATSKVEACQKKIEKAQAKIKKLQGHLNTRASTMYRSGALTYLDVLMGASSFDDFATMWDTLNSLNEGEADLVLQTKEAKAELKEAKKELVANQKDAEDQLATAESYKADVEATQAEYEATYNSLSAEYQRLVEQERAAREAAQARAAAAYTPSASSSSSSSSSGGGGGGESASSGGGGGESSSSGGGGGSSSGGGGGGNSSAVSRAQACLGLPYQYGSAGPGSYDCSGLVSYALTGAHGHAWVAESFWAMPTVSDPQPGDVVACNSHHCGLYIGGGMMIEAPHTGASVCVSAVRGKIVRP